MVVSHNLTFFRDLHRFCAPSGFVRLITIRRPPPVVVAAPREVQLVKERVPTPKMDVPDPVLAGAPRPATPGPGTGSTLSAWCMQTMCVYDRLFMRQWLLAVWLRACRVI